MSLHSSAPPPEPDTLQDAGLLAEDSQRERQPLEALLREDLLTDDAITAEYRVYQRKHGHRYSVDDVVTAWHAAQLQPEARRVIDLGTGIGSVLHMLAYKLPDAMFATIEAQAVSYALLQRNLTRNGLNARAFTLHGDMRVAENVAALKARFPEGADLITGTPPYQPLGTGTLAPDPQKRAARAELRGGVEVYIAAAAELLAADGVLAVCGDARTPQRVLDACALHGLVAVERRDVWPSANHKGPLFSVWSVMRRAAAPLADPEQPAMFPTRLPTMLPAVLPAWIARDEHGARTEQAHALREFFGLATTHNEAASPRLRERMGDPRSE